MFMFWLFLRFLCLYGLLFVNVLWLCMCVIMFAFVCVYCSYVCICVYGCLMFVYDLCMSVYVFARDCMCYFVRIWFV